jgi:phosphatidylserine/phosphatidylglycerophosphate/cardiolipin synthase-like enzyme
MANNGVRGRVVDQRGQGIQGLTVTAVDFDPFFNQDDVLKTGKTDGNGDFHLTYSAEAYSTWKADRRPDLVVQIYGPRYDDPTLFGTRLLHETKEVKDVDVEVLDVGSVTIHSDNIDGWLVTNATLNPAAAAPVALFQKNQIKPLVDGDAMFPAVTDAANEAKESINLMTLFFDVKNDLITKFKPTFDFANPPANQCKQGMESTLEEILLTKAANPSAKPVNVLVTNVPLSASDTVTEVEDFFRNTGVSTSSFSKGFALLHAKVLIVDGQKAILMGSPLKQFYFSDRRHAIHDARHKGSLNHDVSIEVSGPAVAHISKTFETIWRSTGKPFRMITPATIDPKEGDDTASVQVVRTLPGGTFKGVLQDDETLPHGETGILEAYERAIINAERFIYIENQYFTSPEIIDALLSRMKDTSKPKLQIIIVVPFRPDLPGYPDQHIQNINQLKTTAKAKGHQLGVFTMWTRVEKPGSSGADTSFEIMPIYVHSKVAIVDDKWATVGSANLDGTSMNYHEIGLIVSGAIGDRVINKLRLGNDVGKFLWETFWYVFFFIGGQLIRNFKTLLILIAAVLKLAFDFKDTVEEIRKTMANSLEAAGEIADIVAIVKDAFTRPARHALPNRSRQPSRSVELNVVLYNDIAGQPKSTVIRALRERLWTEHLGLETLPPSMQTVPSDPSAMKWVDEWNARAKEHLEAMKTNRSLPSPQPKILPWVPETNAEDYLRELKVRTKNLRNKADVFDFKKCKFDTKKDFLPWPII